jgi:hypothetical protein
MQPCCVPFASEYLTYRTVYGSVPDPNPDPRVFGLPDPLVRGMDPDPALDPDPDPSIMKQI